MGAPSWKREREPKLRERLVEGPLVLVLTLKACGLSPFGQRPSGLGPFALNVAIMGFFSYASYEFYS